MARSTPPAGYEDLQRSEFNRVFGRIVGVRMAVAPVVASMVLLLAVWEPSPWRRALLIATPVVMLSVSAIELWRFRRQGMTPRAMELNLQLIVYAPLLIAFVTGGVESPAMVVVPLVALLLGLVGQSPWYHWSSLAAQLAAPWLFAQVAQSGALADFNPHLFGGGARSGHGDLHLWISVALLNVFTLAAHSVGMAVRRIFDGMLWRALEASDALRKEQEERARSLVTLTGEIAHELKNPMSSVKGLAALLSQSVGDGKGAERLAVLRQEVDRMQGILQEFLAFSRPLLPLAVESADLRDVCDGVIALHEGLARERGVSLSVRGAARVRCDPRRVRQVIINLVQNAIEASPRSSAVELLCEGAGQSATVRVLDRGPGLDPAVAQRLFQPGATTKPRGTGVGLTFARALARQHGGELELGPREGGGCAAVLTLPAQVPEVVAAPVAPAEAR